MNLVVIGGATATGKTALAIRLAQYFGTEIISADSRQFFRGLDIGTAKPNPAELATVPHHCIDFLDVTQDFSVGDFERVALHQLEHIFTQHKTAILVGGSGLYLRAVYEGLDTFPAVPDEIRAAVMAGERAGGLAWLQNELRRLDPAYLSIVDLQNPARVRRAVEVSLTSGQPYSSFLARQKPPRSFRPVLLLLELPRPELYARIDARVDHMIAAGLEMEVHDLLPFRNCTALKTVGYTEFFAYFDGKISREETIAQIKQHSRNYAKRQATWFRKHGDWQVFHPADWRGIQGFLRMKDEGLYDIMHAF